MSPKQIILNAALISGVLLLSGCGQSGPLYLPPPSSTPNSTPTP